MTCIAAAFRSPTEYALGADSCREWRGTRTIGYKPKRWGPCLFATAGSSPTGDALARALMALDPNTQTRSRSVGGLVVRMVS